MFLKASGVPVFDFNPSWYDVSLKYVSSALPLEMEMGVVIVGPLSPLLLLCFAMAVSGLSQSLLHAFPTLLSCFVGYFGLAACLDPLLIFLVDIAAGNYNCSRVCSST